ncbi:LacI family DNA-binding transcriptional regulator [Ligilactobacillus acidipiscis]|uniref:LacI family DNA-binding transcriptional regulator n=1 Tax=Ligilactobacillus acidipiscis TaxID=89059 RepID=UPI0023F948FE|nr:LacI family DNA-binding transcriptional regulator [Ligilactobacillus acidipiscis]WEV57049.1 LacI family DNA-binding transcriptional regulator [Ligilactobacillus acidipiscis]
MTGIQDIAKKAGVSVSTVSYALNGSSKVTEKTRARILKIAREFNYSPNLAGRALKNQKSNIIGLYISDFGGYFYNNMLDGVNQVLRENHYETLVATGGTHTRELITQGLVDGAIVLDPTFPDEVITQYASQGKPIVVMDRKLTGPNIHQVLLDNETGAAQAISSLYETQIDYFILVTGPNDSHDSNERMQAALNAIKKFGDKQVVIVPSDFTIEGGRKAAETISKMTLDSVGIFALNDETAVGLIDELPKFGVELPKDVKIIGFDNDILGSYLQPQLTTIDYSKHHWGQVAAQTLLEMIKNKDNAADHLVRTHIVHRQSLGENN